MNYLFILFICATVLQLGACRKCYVCITAESDQKCQDDFIKTDHAVDTCEDENDVCVKEKISPTEKIASNVVRSCGAKTYCEAIGTKSSYCSVCSEDGCNSSSMTFPCFIIIAPFLIKYFV